MKRRRCAGLRAVQIVAASAALMSGTPRPVASQTSLGYMAAGDVTFANKHIWRGATRSNLWVMQPHAYLTIGKEALDASPLDVTYVAFTVGGWANLELQSGDGEDLSDRGAGERGLTEINPWFQLRVQRFGQDFAVGATRYYYQGDPSVPNARTSASNTTELFFSWRVASPTIEPSVSWWFDPFDAKGSYIETSFIGKLKALPLPIPRAGIDPLFGALYLEVRAGWSAGFGVNPADPTERAHFQNNGLTHVAVAATTSVMFAQRWSIEPTLHLQANRDPVTKTASASPLAAGQALTWWLTVTVSALRLFGRGLP